LFYTPAYEFCKDIALTHEKCYRKESVPQRDRKKNGSCFAKQKNGLADRECAGYDQPEGLEEQIPLAAAYAPPTPTPNSFTPPKSKTRAGSKVINVYGEPGNPFARLAENAGLPQAYKDSPNTRMPLTTRQNFSRMPEKLSCVYVNAPPRATLIYSIENAPTTLA
jgi:hypothetical protein